MLHWPHKLQDAFALLDVKPVLMGKWWLARQEAIDEVQQQATAEGAFGRAPPRSLAPARPDVQLPDGAAWGTVKVRSVPPPPPPPFTQLCISMSLESSLPHTVKAMVVLYEDCCRCM